jgi:NADH-ubiquinone oxidoreductase chain 1
MINYNSISNIAVVLWGFAEVFAVLLPVLMAIAFMTIIERKELAALQRRIGPNTVG